MTILEAIQARHSVRSYLDKVIPTKIITELNCEIADCNQKGDLHIQLITDEPRAFDSMMAHYGKFSGVKNYIALVGKKSVTLDEKLGYYGELLTLKAQILGLNTCWVALTFSKSKCKAIIQGDEKLVCVISLGLGTTQGVPHKSKSIETLCIVNGETPSWFSAGMEAALLAPTATNQQKFLLTQTGNSVLATATGGFYSMLDLGIVKYHFEVGAGTENFSWA